MVITLGDVYPSYGLLVMMAKIPDLEKTTDSPAWG
jgi:hypothetical protein